MSCRIPPKTDWACSSLLCLQGQAEKLWQHRRHGGLRLSTLTVTQTEEQPMSAAPPDSSWWSARVCTCWDTEVSLGFGDCGEQGLKDRIDTGELDICWASQTYTSLWKMCWEYRWYQPKFCFLPDLKKIVFLYKNSMALKYQRGDTRFHCKLTCSRAIPEELQAYLHGVIL